MTFTATGNAPVGVHAHRKTHDNPADGYVIVVGSTRVELSKSDAERLGRWLLFEDNERTSNA